MRRAGGFIALAVLVAPRAASAHMVSTGLGDFYDGLLHPFLSLSQLLPALALGIWAGGRGAAAGRAAVLMLPACWLLGGLVGAELASVRPWLIGAALCGLLAGIAGAADLAAPRLVVGALAGVAGFVLGTAGSVTEPAPNWRLSLGIATAAGIIGLLVAGQRAVLAGAVAPVVARVAASWVAAASLLQLGWIARGHLG